MDPKAFSLARIFIPRVIGGMVVASVAWAFNNYLPEDFWGPRPWIGTLWTIAYYFGLAFSILNLLAYGFASVRSVLLPDAVKFFYAVPRENEQSLIRGISDLVGWSRVGGLLVIVREYGGVPLIQKRKSIFATVLNLDQNKMARIHEVLRSYNIPEFRFEMEKLRQATEAWNTDSNLIDLAKKNPRLKNKWNPGETLIQLDKISSESQVAGRLNEILNMLWNRDSYQPVQREEMILLAIYCAINEKKDFKKEGHL
jgi:hypothetical protein